MRRPGELEVLPIMAVIRTGNSPYGVTKGVFILHGMGSIHAYDFSHRREAQLRAAHVRQRGRSGFPLP